MQGTFVYAAKSIGQHASTSCSKCGNTATVYYLLFSTMLPEENDAINHKEKRTRIDWQSLRTQSLQPGGFGEERITIWYAITTLWAI